MQGKQAETPETVLEQRHVSCLGQEVLLALTGSGICYVSLPNSCAALGLNTRGQFQRIQRTPELFAGLRQLPLHTRGGPQHINCLQVALLPKWIAGLRERKQGNDWEARIAAYERLITEAARQLEATLLVKHPVIAAPEISGQADQAKTLPAPTYRKKTQAFVQPALFSAELEEDLEERRALLATLPGMNSQEVLITTSFQEDRAIREASLAREKEWEEEPATLRMRYVASNKLHVYLGDPDYPLSLAETLQAIRDLGESTVLTARIVLGLWNIRRCDRQLAKDGSAAIRLDDILEWRGVQKHRRPAYQGSPKMSTDGYQWKHKQEVHRDLKLLELCHLRGYHMINVQGRLRQFRIDGPYLRLAPVTETAGSAGEIEVDTIVGYFIAPGAWINTYEEYGNLFLAEIDRRIFQLHPQNDQIALRIALYLTEHWRQHLRSGRYSEPLIMQELLAASMVPIDSHHLTTRFAPRVETALAKLHERGIVSEARCISTVDKTKSQWGREWLHSRWHILPPPGINKLALQAGHLRPRAIDTKNVPDGKEH